MRKLIVVVLLVLSYPVFSQQEIFATDSNGDLYSYDLTNCTKSFIGSTSIGFGDIALTTNNELWGIENGNLYHINKLNGVATFVNDISIFPVSLVGINDTILFAEYQMNLYSINTNSADANLIGYLGYSADGDLIWDGQTLFMLTPFVKIELNKSLNQILKVTSINSSVPVSQGSVLFGDNYYTLVAFSGSNVYKVCQLDGSFELLCSNLNFDGIPGAASSITGLKPLNSINVFTPNADGHNDCFILNGNLDNIDRICIVNRWGEEIIELKYPFVWDGRLRNGDEALEGVYFYIISIKEDCVINNFDHGIIHLIR